MTKCFAHQMVESVVQGSIQVFALQNKMSGKSGQRIEEDKQKDILGPRKNPKEQQIRVNPKNNCRQRYDGIH